MNRIETDTNVEAKNLVFCYPNRSGDSKGQVLDNLSIAFKKGSWSAIMGPSGSGKTTLLNCLSGLLQPNSGHVIINGTTINGLSDARLAKMRATSMGFIFQNFNNLEALRSWQNVSISAVASGLSKRLDKQAAKKALERLGMVDIADRYPTELSGGQQQRIAIARILFQSPAIVFADEPTGALDRHSARTVMNQLGLLRQMGATVVMVTHDPWIAAFADSVNFLRDGALVGRLVGADAAEIAIYLSHLEETV